jgi:CRISPR-associated endonuclease/helicase Cas3
MTTKPIAHVSDDGRTHGLQDHLLGTAERSADFASVFGFRQWGRVAGLWHDLGKNGKPFQKKIWAAAGIEAHLEAKAHVDHSTAGGIYAIKKMGLAGRILAYLIAGHHAGLPDWEADGTGRAALSHRLLQTELLDTALSNQMPSEILNEPFPVEKPIGRDPAFWIRILFSCLVDADFLDTEAFFDSDKATKRGMYPELSEMLLSFSKYMICKQSDAPDTLINRFRADILSRCIEMAKENPGVFSLTVPTGGGKTLSSMAFALHHAVIHGKRKIIYVIPYTSIIEQNADQFRDIFGDAVVEHHSNLDDTSTDQETSRSRLACENWDAPIIVTTNVQFFESLYACRTSRCRKLHNIAESVVVLDEAQLMPTEFLKPILKTLDELRNNYGVTVILCTATQPAFGPQKSPGFNFEGLDGIREIMENPIDLYNNLKRVTVKLPDDIREPMDWVDLADELVQHSTVLCIVNRRDDCRLLWSLMPKDTFHLSALMCGAHRSKQIAQIKARLKAGLPTRVISTQLVEAGVDFDFPVVYRAIAGLDSIAQAAGRCNREGLLHEGVLHIFIPPTRPPVGILRQSADIGARLLENPILDPLDPTSFTAYFRELYWLQGDDRLDSKKVLTDLVDATQTCRFSFRTAAKKFKLIDDAYQAPVIVTYGEGAKFVEQLTYTGPERWLLRKLQRYVVNLPRYLHDRLRIDGAIREIHSGIFIQGHGSLYSEDIGFCSEKSISYEPDELIA